MLRLFSNFHYSLIYERSIGLYQYPRFSNKKEKYQAGVCFQKWETKKYKKEIRTKELNLCPYISVLL